MRRKYDEGFTLIELVVTIVTASIVTLAATTVLLLGLRLTRESRGTVSQQSTVRIMLSAMERMVTEGTIRGIETEGDNWKILGNNDAVLFTYVKDEAEIKSSDSVVLMSDVKKSKLELNNNLMTISVTTEDGEYQTSVCCRTAVAQSATDQEETDVKQEVDLGNNITKDEDKNGENDITQTEIDGRLAFAKQLIGQLGSTGQVMNEVEPVYFAKWYEPSWPKETPWCACFLSWALCQNDVKPHTPVDQSANFKWFANVDYWMADFIQGGTRGHWEYSEALWYSTTGEEAYEPITGDLIFFDWNVDENIDPEHVGVVLSVDKANGYVYTIEGNASNRVTMRKYPINDMRILGYGVLNWAK